MRYFPSLVIGTLLLLPVAAPAATVVATNYGTLLGKTISNAAEATAMGSVSAPSPSVTMQTDGTALSAALDYPDIHIPLAVVGDALLSRPAWISQFPADVSSGSDFAIISSAIGSSNHDWPDQVAPIPEPSTYLAALLVSAALACRIAGRRLPVRPDLARHLR
jgi:hypothetical protein